MPENSASPEPRPIGYWLKLVDRLIDDRLDELLAGHDLTRRHWQTLNVVHRESATIEQLDDHLRPFLDERHLTVRPVVDDLVSLGWTARDSNRIRFNPEMDGAFTQLLAEVSDLRAAIGAGISEDEYQAAVRVLEQMANNLAPEGTSEARTLT